MSTSAMVSKISSCCHNSDMSYCSHIHFETFPVHDAAQSAQHFFGNLIDPENYMKHVLHRDSSYSWSDYGTHVVHAMLPWIAFFALVLLLWVLSFVVIVVRSCCCRGRIKQGGKGVCVIITMVLCLAVMGMGAACLVFTDMLYQGVQQSECAAYRLTNDLQDGTLGRGGTFIGLTTAQNDLASLPSQLQDYDTKTDQVWVDTDWLDTDPEQLLAQIQAYQAAFKDTLSVSNPDPSSTTAMIPTIYGQNFELAISQLNSDISKQIGLVDVSLSTLKSTTEDSKSDIQDLLNNVDTAQASLQNFSDGVEKLHSNMNKWFLHHSDAVQSGWTGLLLCFGYLIVTGMLCFLLTSCVLATRAQGKRGCYYLIWLLFGVTAAGGAALAMFLVGGSIIMKDACGVTDNLSTTEGLQRYDYLIPSKVEPFLNLCFNGNGDVTDYLGLTADLSLFTSLITQVNSVLTELNNVSLTSFPGLNYNQQYVGSFTSKDYDAIVPAPAPTSFLNTLTSWTNSQVANSLQTSQGGCKAPTMDTWVFIVGDCTGTVIDPTDPLQDLGTAACLVVQAWDEAQVRTRYEPYLDCTYKSQGQTVPEIIIAAQKALANFANSVDSLGNQLSTTFSTLSGNMYAAGLRSKSLLTTKVNPYIQEFNPSITAAASLSSNLNCQFLNEDYDNAQTSVCKNVLPSLFLLMLLTSIASLLYLVALVPVLIMARRKPKTANQALLDIPAFSNQST